MPRPHDYAILVGIEDYPNIAVSPLSGPVRDVEYFEQWLLDPNGGDVDPAHIFKLTSMKPPPQDVDAEEFPPTEEQFKRTLRRIVMPDGELQRRLEGRLYLYFSGHGFSDFRERSLHAALYTANARKDETSNVCGTKFAEWCQRAAAFGEVILVMDCCRDVELSKEVLPATFNDKHDPKLAKLVRVMEIYAVPYGGKAQERVFSDKNGYHGLLTYALVAGLYGAPREKLKNDLVRTGHSLKTFIEGCWRQLAGDDGPEPPEFVLPRSGDIVFSSAPPRADKRRIVLAPPVAGLATLRVVDTDEQERARVELDAVNATAAIQYAGAAAPVATAFDGTHVELELAPEMYDVFLDQAGAEVRHSNMHAVGDQHVQL